MSSKSQTTRQTTDQSGTSAYTPSPQVMGQWANILNQGMSQANYLISHPPSYPGQAVAGPGGLTSGYWNQAAQGITQPGYAGLQGALGNIYNQIGGQGVDPRSINLPGFNAQSFKPGDVNLPGFGTVPTVSAPGGVSGAASSYYVSPEQVQAAQIGGLERVLAPQLQQYQMGQAQQVGAPDLANYQMQAAPGVAPQGQVGTETFTQPGAAGAYMSPYTQQVVGVQQQQAIQDWQQALEGQRSQAAASGAYGGTRQAVQEATGQRDLQLQLAQIQATGLQNAFQQAQQQFNVEQAARQQAGQFNIQTGLQAQLANQQAQQQANVQNLASYLQTQGLSATEALQAALANQQAGITVGGQNLQALLQTQGLGAQTGLQAQLANQQQGLQSALANQQAQMSAQQLNQAANLQAGLAAQQMGQQGAEFTAGQQLQAGLANQASQMQALGLQYQGGLQAALQTQALGMQGQMLGGQMGLSAAVQQEALRQQQMGINLGALQQQQGAVGALANLGQMGLQNQIAGLGAMAAPAMAQQGYLQQIADQRYQQWLQQQQAPFQAAAYEAALLGMQPLPYTTASTMQGTGTLTQPGPSIWSQLLGAGLGAAGIAGKLIGGGGREGGAVSDTPFGTAIGKKKPRRFQGGGWAESGLGYFTPHYPQPIMPPIGSMPDLMSHVKMYDPQQQSLLNTVTGELKDKDSGIAGGLKKIIGLFKKKPDDTSAASTDGGSSSGDTVTTSSTTQTPANEPAPAPPVQTITPPLPTTTPNLPGLAGGVPPELSTALGAFTTPPAASALASPLAATGVPNAGPGPSSLLMAQDRNGENIYSNDGGRTWIYNRLGTTVPPGNLPGGTAANPFNVGPGYAHGGLAEGGSPSVSSSIAYDGVGDPSNYRTRLSPAQEHGFQGWLSANQDVPGIQYWRDTPTSDYDMRGFYHALQMGDPRAATAISPFDRQPHFPDAWKTPYHRTFSNESIYAPPDAPHWEGDRLIDKSGRVIADETPVSKARGGIADAAPPELAAALGAITTPPHFMADVDDIPGLLTPGNIDLDSRPMVRNPDGSISTVRSMSFGVNGKEVLVPTVSEDGRIMSNREALDQYRQTGRHLGIFDSPENATAYSKQLHEEQDRQYNPRAQARGGLAHSDAAEDRRQTLAILREKKLIKGRGGLAAALPKRLTRTVPPLAGPNSQGLAAALKARRTA